jgi:hypothetical protein
MRSTCASARDTSLASSLSRARDASARQRAAFQRFTSERRLARPHPSSSSNATTTTTRTTTTRATNDGNVFVESFFDLADTVAGGRESPGFSRLADAIGRDVYVQVGAWRLYVKDMKFHDGLAKVFAVKLAANGNSVDDAVIHDVLSVVRVPLGGGKADVPLEDLCPSASVNNLKNVLRDYVDDRL